MSDDDSENKEHVRKSGGGIWMTHRQLGGAAVIGALSITLGQLQNIREFFTGDQAKTIVEMKSDMNKGFERLERQMQVADGETTLKVRRVFDILSSDIAKTENRCEGRIQDVTTRISNLETYAFRRKSGT